MTQEEKRLLLKDLAAKLPYGVIVQYRGHNTIIKNKLLTGSDLDCNMEYYKPYLRPMTSMTEEEKKAFIKFAMYDVREAVNGRHYEYYLIDDVGTTENPSCNSEAIDWLNKNYFDYRGLIENGLAIEVTEENNPYKN